MTDFSAFSQLVPGFDFMQGLAKNANPTLPGLGQWVAPTLDPAELDKRIGELRTVQFWLEQNVRMVDATIRALEVQRMTLSTLQTLNVRTEDLRNALKITMPPLASSPSAAPDAAPAPGAAATGAPVDPLQWWSALTQQFATLATNAINESTAAGAGTAPESPGSKSPGKKGAGSAKDAAGRGTAG